MDKLGGKINSVFESSIDKFCLEIEEFFEEDLRSDFFGSFNNKIDLFYVWKEIETQIEYENE